MQYRLNRQQETFSELNKPMKLLTILGCDTHAFVLFVLQVISSPENTNIHLKHVFCCTSEAFTAVYWYREHSSHRLNPSSVK